MLFRKLTIWVLGLLSIGPILVFLGSGIWLASKVASSTYSTSALDASMQMRLYGFLLALLLIAGYLIYLFYTEHVPKEKKVLWGVVLVLGNIFAIPFFWFFYLRPRGS